MLVIRLHHKSGVNVNHNININVQGIGSTQNQCHFSCKRNDGGYSVGKQIDTGLFLHDERVALGASSENHINTSLLCLTRNRASTSLLSASRRFLNRAVVFFNDGENKNLSLINPDLIFNQILCKCVKGIIFQNNFYLQFVNQKCFCAH